MKRLQRGKIAGAAFRQFEITKSSAASSSAAHATEIVSRRLSLLWIMTLPNRQRHYSGNSLLFHRECKKCQVCELGRCEHRGRGRSAAPVGNFQISLVCIPICAFLEL
jgi:hypothetical protein